MNITAQAAEAAYLAYMAHSQREPRPYADLPQSEKDAWERIAEGVLRSFIVPPRPDPTPVVPTLCKGVTPPVASTFQDMCKRVIDSLTPVEREIMEKMGKNRPGRSPPAAEYCVVKTQVEWSAEEKEGKDKSNG